MKILHIVMLLCFTVLLSGTALSQQPQKPSKPTISVVQRPPDAVPEGSCKVGESGYLQNSDGHNHFTSFTPSEIGNYVADRMKNGYVVTLYPQPNGLTFVIATCGDPYTTKS